MEHKQLKISPRVIKHLGKDLITSSEVAVTELIKNSIDAKAEKIKLLLFENSNMLEEAGKFSIPVYMDDIYELVAKPLFYEPLLIVEDNGKGMDEFQLEKGFLEIGTDLKSNNGQTTLGEKGIGRLAVQRLGKYLLVETASASEPFATLTFINWDEISSSGNSNYFVPYKKTKKMGESYTRLWIFGIHISDFLETPAQMVFHFDNSGLIVNRELKSAINFLISPFHQADVKTSIQMFYNHMELDIDFPDIMLQLSESTHKFGIRENNGEIVLKYELRLQPWYIERVHRVLAKPEAFKRLRKEHGFYKDLLKENKDRIESVLVQEVRYPELFDLVAQTFYDMYEPGITDKNIRKEFSVQKAEECLKALMKILPVSGEIFSFKQNAAIGENIIIESLKEIHKGQEYSLKALKEFLKDYNGIKLYRDIYRIGFLGDKENDWIKLQQFRTKGQQWYRFDLGNTVGYVSVRDPEQKNIQEISSRLDINQNEVSDAFKLLIGIVFNHLFYELNKKSNDIIKVLLMENGLLEDNISKRVRKNSADIEKYIVRNKRVMADMQKITKELHGNVKIEGEKAFVPVSLYEKMEKVLKNVTSHFGENEKAQKQAASLLVEADEQLKAIEVESYNNYKLMANGLITETITHELHSVSKMGIAGNMEDHFRFLKDYFVEQKNVKAYNTHVYPVQTGYSIIAGKINDVANLYSFLENTFIKKGTYEEFVFQQIQEVVRNIEENLVKTIRNNDIQIVCRTEELVWFVPKGVLIHVFYNLFNNSIYWIDKRRKFAEADHVYKYSGKDQIIVELYGNGVVVYDTGTGVLRTMEDILFEPLESGKPNHEGRGMGLYIVKKILNSFNAGIELLAERNVYGNRYKFLICMADGEG